MAATFPIARFRERAGALVGSALLHAILLVVVLVASRTAFVLHGKPAEAKADPAPRPLTFVKLTAQPARRVRIGDGSEGKATPPAGGGTRAQTSPATDRPGYGEPPPHATATPSTASAPLGLSGPGRSQPGLRVVLEDDATVDAVVRLGGPVLAYIPSNRALLEMRISDGKMLPVVQPAAFFGARSVMVDPEGNPYFAPDTNPARLRAARRAHPDASLWVGIPASLFARWIAAVPVDVQHIAVRWEEYHGFKVRGS